MKSFKQHINEGNIEHYGDKNDVNFFDGSEKSMQVMSAYLGSISEREFMNPDAAVHQIYNKLSSMGMDFKVPASEGQSGSHTVEVVQVPTYGKIYKIIDFGRAIYKFKGNIVCSDSFHPKGDAATQYNCEPYFNNKKPRLEPNPSFDLCRLGCSLYDFFVDDESEDPFPNPLSNLISEWTTDDKGRNILYKKTMA